MHTTALVTLNMRELDRFKVIQDVADGRLQPWRAAERLINLTGDYVSQQSQKLQAGRFRPWRPLSRDRREAAQPAKACLSVPQDRPLHRYK